MINFFSKSFLFFVILFIQIFFIDKMDFGELNYFFSPLIYGLIIITIQPSVELWILMLIAFVMGLSIDLFRNTIGLNISALVLVAFLKNPILNFMFPRDGYDPLKDLTPINIGWNSYFLYVFIMLFIHHLWFLLIEDFHFTQLLNLFFKALVISFSALFLFVLFYFLSRKIK
jgi:hypothetical protein